MSENGPTVFVTWGAKDKKNKLEYNATDTFVCNEVRVRVSLKPRGRSQLKSPSPFA